MLIERLWGENAKARETLAQEKATRRSLEAELEAAKAAAKEDEEEEMKGLETPNLTNKYRTEGDAAAKKFRLSDVSFSSGMTTSTSSGRSPYFEK